MKTTSRRISHPRTLTGICGLLLFVAGSGCVVAEPSPAAITAFDSYAGTVEARLARQHQSREDFLVPAGAAAESEARLRRGELVVGELTPPGGAALPGALFHHWRGTAFAAGARAADFERMMRDFSSYPQYFWPQVLRASVLTQDGDRFEVAMRVRQRHVITVVMDTTYDVGFGRLDERRGYSISRSTEVSEIESAGTSKERALSGSEDHGFLWRLDTYWSYEERDGGLYVQIETVSLTRSIPTGLGWVVRPFVESVPRDSLEFTLRAVCNGLKKK